MNDAPNPSPAPTASSTATFAPVGALTVVGDADQRARAHRADDAKHHECGRPLALDDAPGDRKTAPTTAVIGATRLNPSGAQPLVQHPERDHVADAGDASEHEVVAGDVGAEGERHHHTAPTAADACETRSTPGVDDASDARPPRKSPEPYAPATRRPRTTATMTGA